MAMQIKQELLFVRVMTGEITDTHTHTHMSIWKKGKCVIPLPVSPKCLLHFKRAKSATNESMNH